MSDQKENKAIKSKGFFARWFEKLDQKMAEKAQQCGCCCSQNQDKKDKPCC